MRRTHRISEDAISRIVRNVITEARERKSRINEGREKYTHLAVNKETGLIVNGWDYRDVDADELRQFKNDYFNTDLKDYGFNPKYFKVVTAKFADKNGINTWSNTGVFPLNDENEMKREGVNFYQLAHEQHPEFFIDDNVNESINEIGDTYGGKYLKGRTIGRQLARKDYSNLNQVNPYSIDMDGMTDQFKFERDPKSREQKKQEMDGKFRNFRKYDEKLKDNLK